MATLKICTGRSCTDHGSKYLFDRAQVETPTTSALKTEACGCLGMCEKGANIMVEDKDKKTPHHRMTGPSLAVLIKSLLGKKK